MTQKQVNDINSKCKNGFHFHILGFQESGRKKLVKTITIKEEEKMVEIQLYWIDEIIHKKNEYGCNMPHLTGNVIPRLIISVWKKKKEDKCWVSWDSGVYYQFEAYPSTKKMINKLCEATALASDELIHSLLPENVRAELLQLENSTNL